ncbi:hypothetical protein [Mesonia aquimarina]|uniref:hypothetical protein n=1 Tax=Mesonia aquimarina TaxID=1504967 RepID=UPI0019694604|nr:hypothetical protein [Mesonia aquimarina]
MKNLIILFICFTSYISFSQNEELDSKYWNGSQNGNTEIPEKWKNESAVILFQEYYYDYHKFGRNVKYTKSIHKRIKLQDQASVKEFSEFNFDKRFKVDRGYFGKRGTKTLGVKVIKPSGEERIISVDEEAVEKEENEYKLAISGLEVGDIIDYYVHIVEPFKQKEGYLFELNTEVLNDYYPCKEYVLKLQTENDFFINFNSYNGAPKLEEIQTEKRNDRLYVLRAKEIEKNDFPIWFYPRLKLPYYKFQTTFARRSAHEEDVFNFISEDEEIIKNEVTKEEVLTFFKEKFRKLRNYSGTLPRRYFKDRDISQKEMVEEAYYYLRYHRKVKYIQPSVINELDLKDLFNPFAYYPDLSYFNNENHFLKAFGETLSDNDIPFSFIIAVPKYKGSINDILSTDDIKILIKVNLDKPIYLSYFDMFSTLELNSPYFENTKAYELPYNLDKKRIKEIYEITIPGTEANQNYSKDEMEVSFDNEFSKINIQSKNKYSGHFKEGKQEDILYFFDYVDEDHKRFNTQDYFQRLPKKKSARHKEKYDALVEKITQERNKNSVKYLNRSFDFKVKDNTIEVLNTGRENDQDELIFQNTFIVENDLIKKAGPNYIFEIGKLNGKQLDLDDEDRKRKEDIYMNFPRTYESKIQVDIPKGFKVIGLENLNIKRDNKFASFISSAKIENNKLTLQATKTYKQTEISNDNWGEILEVLDASLKFNSQKVMFEKI